MGDGRQEKMLYHLVSHGAPLLAWEERQRDSVLFVDQASLGDSQFNTTQLTNSACKHTPG